ncbi:MAG TPA: glycosyltransferase [Bacteroidales bacterium]|nr:glycosyltransferase [Bacteroidales bacterium]
MGNEIILERSGVEVGDFLQEDPDVARAYYNIEKPKAVEGEILFLTSYPPRECGIANYSLNLLNALHSRLDNYYGLKVCALENGDTKYYYPGEVVEVLNTSVPSDYMRVAVRINQNTDIVAVVIQHEFDLFKGQEDTLLNFIKQISKPVVVVFHSVIPHPSPELKMYVQNIAAACKSVITMGSVARSVVLDNYYLPPGKVEAIPYGTHQVAFVDSPRLKEKLKIEARYLLTAVGLLAPGKGFETILEALPAVIKSNPGVKLLIIGKTHPEELKKGGEQYRILLEARVKSLKLQSHVEFMNVLLTPDTLKEYFQVSDISIFSSNDINRPTSSIFSFAVSCGCPIISTPTLHAREFLDNGAGMMFECRNSQDLADKIIQLLENPGLRKSLSENVLKRSQASAWENSSLLYARMLNNIAENKIAIDLKYPPIQLDFLKMLTDKVGILRESYKNKPDFRSGYILDDNALALFVFCMHYKNTRDIDDLPYIRKYLKFVSHCFQPSGMFFKYMDYQHKFTPQNKLENLEETQAKAIWALGYVYSMKGLLPAEMTDVAGLLMENMLPCTDKFETAKRYRASIFNFSFNRGESTNATW